MNYQSTLDKCKGPLAGAAVWLCLAGHQAFAQTPQWWVTRGVLNQSLAHDYAPINQGQLKWLASNAYAEVSNAIGPDTNLTALIDSLSISNNYLPVNIGQVKYLAAPFYDRLYEFGLTNAMPPGMLGRYPWDGRMGTNDYALVNIGQAKYAFSFSLSIDPDADYDGRPDWWEVIHRTDSNNADVAPPTISIQEPANGTRIVWVP